MKEFFDFDNEKEEYTLGLLDSIPFCVDPQVTIRRLIQIVKIQEREINRLNIRFGDTIREQIKHDIIMQNRVVKMLLNKVPNSEDRFTLDNL